MIHKQISAIQSVPKPVTKKQMMSFVTMTSHCRKWILNCSEREAPLSSLKHGKNLSAHDKVTWTPDAEKAFDVLKAALTIGPTLVLPNPNLPYAQFVYQKNYFITSIICQPHGGILRLVS